MALTKDYQLPYICFTPMIEFYLLNKSIEVLKVFPFICFIDYLLFPKMATFFSHNSGRYFKAAIGLDEKNKAWVDFLLYFTCILSTLVKMNH